MKVYIRNILPPFPIARLLRLASSSIIIGMLVPNSRDRHKKR